MKPTNKEIYEDLALKYKLTPAIIEEICRSQFEFTKHVIREGKLSRIRLMYLGYFGVSKVKLQIIRFNTKQAAVKRKQDEDVSK